MPTSKHESSPIPGPCDEDIQPRVQPLRAMFTAVPASYDFLNRALTWGFDERWRRRAARECLRDSRGRVLDLCCGTGDLALHLAELAGRDVEVAGLDFCEPMLEIARAKASARGLGRKVTFLYGDAAELPFPDGHFAVLGMSFAFRNITYHNPLRHRYLSEIVRVLAREGKFVIVETSQPRMRALHASYHLYLKTVVPRVGGFLSGHHGAYRYLAESARRFYRAEEVSGMLIDAGFREVRFRLLLRGVAAIHVATR